MTTPSKNYRYSTNPQVAIDADTRLVIATGEPQPGDRNDGTVHRESGIACLRNTAFVTRQHRSHGHNQPQEQ